MSRRDWFTAFLMFWCIAGILIFTFDLAFFDRTPWKMALDVVFIVWNAWSIQSARKELHGRRRNTKPIGPPQERLP